MTTVTHPYRTKYIAKDGIILKYNHYSDFRTDPELVKYNLRTDSINAVSKGIISNHQGWRRHNVSPE